MANVWQIRNLNNEMVFLLNVVHILIEFLSLFLERFIHPLFTVSDYNNKGFPGVHLIQGVHEEWECVIIEDKQEDDSFLWLVTGDEGNRPMFHLTGPESLGMNII